MSFPSRPQPDFNAIARPYRGLEYLTLGRALERCRLHFLPELQQNRQAFVLGDGDGRFLAALLAANPHLRAETVDTSATMLHLLRLRCAPFADRLQTHKADARTFNPAAPPDLVVTHFFLDCLTQAEVTLLVARLAPRLQPKAVWLVSDFRIPAGAMHFPARVLVRTLYLAFRIVTGLRITNLPDHAAALASAGFLRIASHHSLAGLLTAELWQLR